MASTAKATIIAAGPEEGASASSSSSSSSSRFHRNRLERFLNRHRKRVRLSDGSVRRHTHIKMPGANSPGGSYTLPPDKATTVEFFHRYARAAVEASQDQGGAGGLNLLEMNDATTPLKVDIDMRQVAEHDPTVSKVSGIPRLVDEQKATLLAVRIMQGADAFLDAESVRVWTPKMLSDANGMGIYPEGLSPGTTIPRHQRRPRTALVFQRPHATADSKGGTRVIKDGIHIIFPELVLSSMAQYTVRGHTVRGLEADQREFKSLAGGDEPVPANHTGAWTSRLKNSIRDMYDNAVIRRNAWCLYGSDKPGKRNNLYGLRLVLHIGRRRGDYVVTTEEPAAYVARVAQSLPPLPGDWSRAERNMLAMCYHLRMRCYDPDSCAFQRPVAAMRTDYSDDPAFLQIVADQFIPVPQVAKFNHQQPQTRTKEDAEYAMQLVRIMSAERAARELDWWRTGAALSNVAMSLKGDDSALRQELLKSWIEFSRRPSQYATSAEAACCAKWGYFERSAKFRGGARLGLNSLEEAARDDNPKAYEALQHRYLHTSLVAALQTRDWEIALMVTRLENAALRHKCVDPAAKIWYNYSDRTGLWKCSRGRHPLRLDIPRKLYPLMVKIVNDMYDAACDNNRHVEHGERINILAAAGKERGLALKKLSPLMSAGKTSAVCSFISELLCDEDFAERLDQNPDIVGLQDGYTYDLAIGECRRSRPTDMLSLSSGQPFYPPGSALVRPRDEVEGAAVTDAAPGSPPLRTSSPRPAAAAGPAGAEGGADHNKFDAATYHIGHRDVQDFLSFISDLFPLPGVSHYVLKWLSSMFEGHVRDELFHVLQGSGANGKSKLQLLMKLIFGSLGVTTSIKTFTGDRADASGATAHLEHLRNKRSVWVQEPSKGERFNIGVLKELTGGDDIYTRGLYQEGSEFTPQAKFALVANDRPALPPDDEAVWRRIRNIKFVTKFVPDPDPNNPNQKKRDNRLDEKIRRFAPAAQWYLLKVAYPAYKREGIIADSQVPAAISKETEQYRSANDEIIDFIQIHMDPAEDVPGDELREEVDTQELTRLFTLYVENRRPRSMHLKVANNERRVRALFEKRGDWKTATDLDGTGKYGWSQWVWKRTQYASRAGLG